MYSAIVVGNILSLAGTVIDLWKNTDKHRARRYGKGALARRTDAALEVFVGTASSASLYESLATKIALNGTDRNKECYQLSPGNGLIRIR